MEFVFSSPTTAMTVIFAFLLFIFYVLRISTLSHTKAAKKKAAPEAGGAWPVIGHLFQLGGNQQLPHKVLGAMADKYGPIFTIRLGVKRVLVVSNAEMAKECLLNNDRAFVNRPNAVGVEVMAYNSAMFGFAPYGPYWRHVRKIATLQLLSNQRLGMLKHIPQSEVKSSVKEIYEHWIKNKSASDSVSLEMKRWFMNVALNTILRMVAGVRHGNEKESGDELPKALSDFLHLIGSFVLSDALPFLRWMDLGGYEKAMKKTAKELDRMLEGWLEEHKVKRSAAGSTDYVDEDFMDVMLSALEGDRETEPARHDADTINKSTCLVLILGGADTTMGTLTWALSLLLNNRRALQKAQDELDARVGRDRQVDDSDLKDLIYLQAIVKETLRLYPAAPLSVPRESTKDCVVDSYYIPSGTRLIVNLWKIHRDPRVWSHPCEFQPERFLSEAHKNVDVRGQHFELIPFGSGRRMCPGISLGLKAVTFTLATLLHAFEMTTPADEPVDMSESVGMTNVKTTPLEVVLKPRLLSHLYL